MMLALAMASAVANSSRAEIADLAPNGFTFQTNAHIAAPADKVFAVLIHPARWWNSDHTYPHDAANLTLDATAGGCFCEKLPGGGSVAHLVVAYIDPGKMLRLRGALGPFQSSGIDGAMTWALKTSADGTDLSLTYAVGGYRKGGFEQISKAGDEMLLDQVARLKRAVETGSPEKR
jgi:uncharacterized protein YndB with AHSA1/START domain